MKKVIRFLRLFFFGSSARGFVSAYLLFMVMGASLLMLPLSIQEGQTLSWIDAMFVSASGLSTTGLSTIVVKDVFTRFGQTVLILIIQFGGIGLIMMVAIFWLAVGKRIGFRERNMIMVDQNQLSRSGAVRFVRNVLIMIFAIEAIAFLIMSGYLILSNTFAPREALYQAFFTTISLFTNAGFDIAPGGDSFQMYANDYFMQSLGMFLMFAGAMGFWPLYELRQWFIAKRRKEHFKFSMFTKILVMMHLIIWFVSVIIVFGLERNHFLADKGFVEAVYYTLFMSLTTRNAGFSTMSINDFTEATRLFFITLMFIGSSPNSAGGGIRTTTLLLIVLGIRAFATGRSAVAIGFRKIKEETVYKSFIVISMAIGLLTMNVILMTVFEPFATQAHFNDSF